MARAPEPLSIRDLALSDLASRYGLTLSGPDRPVSFLALVRSPRTQIHDVLTYVTSDQYGEIFSQSEHEAAIVEARFWSEGRFGSKSVLVSPDFQAEQHFFRIHTDIARDGLVSSVEAHVGVGTAVAPTATVGDHTWIGDNCQIEPGAVIYPNTVVQDGSVIQANATVGGSGFEIKVIDDRRVMIPHTGGVVIGEESVVGSATCIDRGLFGTFTSIGGGTKIDNLVHIAHNVWTGEDCAIVAGAEISGSVHLGIGVWYGPNASCNPELAFGDYAYVGTGSVVVRDVPAFTLVAGSPARVFGNVCRCRSKVDLSSGWAMCERCGTELVQDPKTGNVSVRAGS